MTTMQSVATWLDNYVRAWQSYDPAAIGDLFSEDAVYYPEPFGDALRGRAAIVAMWLEEPDTPGSFKAGYAPLFVSGDHAVANGRSTYFKEDGSTIADEYDNIFVLQFDANGRCSEYREWYMQVPQEQD